MIVLQRPRAYSSFYLQVSQQYTVKLKHLICNNHITTIKGIDTSTALRGTTTCKIMLIQSFTAAADRVQQNVTINTK